MQVNRDYLQAKGGFPYRSPLVGDGIEIRAAALNLRTGRDPDRKILLLVLFAVLALFALASCSDKPKLPKPPFETPVNLSREGVVADFYIRITKHNIYDFEILFEYPEGDQAERERVRKLVGGVNEPEVLSTPVKLTIYKKQTQNEQIVYQKTIESPKSTSAASNFYAKNIGHCDLKRGEYRFVLESLAQPQEYGSIHTKFLITFENFLKGGFIPINVDRSKTCPQ